MSFDLCRPTGHSKKEKLILTMSDVVCRISFYSTGSLVFLTRVSCFRVITVGPRKTITPFFFVFFSISMRVVILVILFLALQTALGSGDGAHWFVDEWWPCDASCSLFSQWSMTSHGYRYRLVECRNNQWQHVSDNNCLNAGYRPHDGESCSKSCHIQFFNTWYLLTH